VNFYASLTVRNEQVFRHSGSVIMSSVYSYEATRRDDPMIERISMILEVIIQELRPEIAAVISAFPYRRRCCPSYTQILISNSQFSVSLLGCLACALRGLHL
jgi:hypothetical protein